MTNKKVVKRPLTIREIQNKKIKKEKSGFVTVYNCSKQLIPIHLNAPAGVDFYLGAQDQRLRPGQTGKFPKSRLRMPQIERLQKQGFIQVLHDSEKQADREEAQAAQEALGVQV